MINCVPTSNVLIKPNRVSNSLLYICNTLIINSFMFNSRMSFLWISIVISLVMIPTFAIYSFSQSNNTLPSELPSSTPLSNASLSDESNDDTLIENDTSFASLSRSLVEVNQTDDEQTAPPPPSTESETDDEQTAPPPPSTESETQSEANQEDGIQ